MMKRFAFHRAAFFLLHIFSNMAANFHFPFGIREFLSENRQNSRRFFFRRKAEKCI